MGANSDQQPEAARLALVGTPYAKEKVRVTEAEEGESSVCSEGGEYIFKNNDPHQLLRETSAMLSAWKT